MRACTSKEETFSSTCTPATRPIDHCCITCQVLSSEKQSLAAYASCCIAERKDILTWWRTTAGSAIQPGISQLRPCLCGHLTQSSSWKKHYSECQLSQKKAILVGHGIGAWIAFLIALQRPELVAGIVGISADPDFTEELLWKHLPEATKETIMTTGESIIQWGEQMYPITSTLIEDGRKNLLLPGPAGGLNVTCLVRLLHALQDEEVPHSLALRLVERCRSPDASILLMHKARHAMLGDREMDATVAAVESCWMAYLATVPDWKSSEV